MVFIDRPSKPRLRSSSIRTLKPVLERLELRRVLANDLSPVLDVNTDLTSYGSRPQAFTTVGTTLFFSAATDATGNELWKSDGTAAGRHSSKTSSLGASLGIPRRK